MEKLYHRGVMRSKVDDCQFVCIRQSDYYRILRQGEENTRRHEEDGVLVLVTEKSHIDTCHREANIVIKGTPERLMLHLVEVENVLDTTYVEDFLLTQRKFIKHSVIVAKKLLEWFEEPKYQDIVTRVFLRWVQSYFTDFEMDPEMMSCLEQFEDGLQRKEMMGQLFFLRMVCMTKARSRTVTLTRPSRDKPLQFSIVGRKNFGIFISSVEKGSKAEEVGLKRADQILEANGQSFSNVSESEAREALTTTCHLAITVRSNLHTYNDLLQTPENAHKGKSRKTSDLTGNGTCPGPLDFVSTLNLNTALSPQVPHNRKEGKGTSMTLKTHKFKEFFASIVTKSNIIDPSSVVCSDDSVSSHSSTGGHLYRSRSNPDLSSTDYEENSKSEFPDHVLKVYRATDQSTRFLPVHKETTAREVVMLSLNLFNITEPSQNFALYEVSVPEGVACEQSVVKQKRLPDGLQNLAERIGLSSRYYLKSVTSSQNLCPDEVVNELIRESQVNILQLSSVVELAIQLTLEDFAIFRQIEPTEYIDNLFKIKSKYGTPALSRFEEISNRELYWVCSEVCSEHNIHKRAKIVKQFIKIARYCKDLNNFNSMFAILSGLGSTSVNRLRQTWARVPNRYRKIFSDLETVMDPSQNMKNYRKLASSSSSQAPMIPFYPIVKKDLLFLNEGNDDEVDGLINFEKLRTISKSIRKLGEMCSTKYCPNKMLEKLGQPQSTAMTAMNQGITGGQQSSTVKRRKKSAAQPDKKKMFEEAQMVRRVKAYLSQLKAVTDEETLMRMSYDCEPPASSHGSMSGSTHMGVGSTTS
ncbi:UNVERIFIED_CONTAM: hypothetical protein GTU68_020311, partial [Idotea baltica]|nr:hypothetical protein [Idotea baltica]